MKIILVGKAGSGKDYFRDYLIKKGFTPNVSHTTRPKREGEIDGETYHFVSDGNFHKMVDNAEFFECKSFNNWYYGTSIKEMKKSDVFIFTPSGIASLPYSFKSQSIIVYFDISQDERVERLRKRSDSDSISRRVLADNKDFKDFKDWNIRIVDSLYDCDYVLRKIKQLK